VGASTSTNNAGAGMSSVVRQAGHWMAMTVMTGSFR
jgi:hypothetical protein